MSHSWGALAERIHGPVPDGRPPWRDSAFLSFWDTEREVFGCAHVATSPNSPTHNIRFEISVRGRQFRVFEDLAPGSFSGRQVDFDLDKGITVNAPQVRGFFSSEPLFAVADYTEGGLVPALVEGERLQNFQQPARVTGHFTVDGEEIMVDGRGWRDRTWGYRDESANWTEYIAYLAIFDDHALTAMKFRYSDGTTASDGFLLGPVGSDPVLVKDIEVTRDAAGLAAAGRFTMADEGTLNMRSSERVGGFWVSMGHERIGPTMSAYDEFTLVSTDQGDGIGTFQHGVIRMLY